MLNVFLLCEKKVPSYCICRPQNCPAILIPIACSGWEQGEMGIQFQEVCIGWEEEGMLLNEIHF